MLIVIAISLVLYNGWIIIQYFFCIVISVLGTMYFSGKRAGVAYGLPAVDNTPNSHQFLHLLTLVTDEHSGSPVLYVIYKCKRSVYDISLCACSVIRFSEILCFPKTTTPPSLCS